MAQLKPKKSLASRIARTTVKTLLFVFLFVLLLLVLILLPPVQNLIKNKAVTYLENKLHTKISIGKIYIGFPKKIIIRDFFIRDQKNDTLAFGSSLKLNIGLWKLIFHGETSIDNIELGNSTVKITRNDPDTSFNYQFIVDAFSPASTTIIKDTDTHAAPIVIRNISLDKVRCVFKDAMTGNDAESSLEHLDLKLDKIDPDHMLYEIPDINVKGLTAYVYQYKPIRASPAPLPVNTSEPVALQLILDKIGLEEIQINYRNDVSAVNGNITIGDARVQVNAFSMDKQLVKVSSLSLMNADVNVKLGKKEAFPKIVRDTRPDSGTLASTDWRIELNSLKLDNSAIQYDDENLARQPTGMDYAHLQMDSLFLYINNFIYSVDSVGGEITKAQFKERNGFFLQALESRFYYGNSGGYLKDLHLKTPGSEIQRDVSVQYPSLAAARSNPGIIEINADIDNSRVSVRDILMLLPDLRRQPAFANAGGIWRLDGKVMGKVNDLNISKFQFSGLSGTIMDVNGTIAGLPDPGKVKADLRINNLVTNRNDLDLFIPAGTLPSNITLPGQLRAMGRMKGDISGLNADLSLQSNLGDATISGLFKNYNDPQHFSYDAHLETKSLQLGVILQQAASIGTLSSSFQVKGVGTDPKTSEAIIDGKVQSVILNGYNYQHLIVKGRMANQLANLESSMVDPNIHFDIKAQADFSKDFPGLVIHGTVDSLKAQALHLTPNLVIYRGNFEADIPVSNPDKPVGNILFLNTLVVNDDKRVQLDSIEITASSTDTGNTIHLKSDVATAEINGRYNFNDLGQIFLNAIQPYFSIMAESNLTIPSRPYDFNIQASIVNSPLLTVFIPGLKKIEPITFSSHFENNTGWNASFHAPYIDMDGMLTRDLDMNAVATTEKIDVKATLSQLSGGSFGLVNTSASAVIAHNQLDFLFNSKDGAGKDKYNLAALLKQTTPGNYALSIKPDGLLLNYEPWTISANNQVLVRQNDINAREFSLQRNGQSLTLLSQGEGLNAPLEAGFSNFKLSTLTGFIEQGTPVADGTLNGKLLFTNITTTPVFTGNLTVDDLAMQQDTVGNVKILMNNKGLNNYFADVTLSGRGNNAHLSGNYFQENENGNQFDFAVNIDALPLATAQAFSMGSISEASGNIRGQFAIKGNINKPSINGDLDFEKAGFNLKMLNSYFTIDQEKIKVSEEGFVFNDFSVKDSAGNILSVNGTAATQNFRNYQFDMTVRANNFRALNSTKKDNRDFYGQLYFNTNMRLTGTGVAPVVDGRLTVNDKTKMTIVLPQEEPGVVDREGVVEFVDKSAGINDSLFTTALDSLNTIGFTGMDISMNLQLDKAADITLVIDEGNGDFLNLQGEASITADIDRTGKIFMSGSYELDQGSYQISFNLLRRKFAIQKGSRISWEGEPTKAKVDITAIYSVSTSPLDLVKNELSEGISTNERNTYLQKLPFEVTLKMTGDLMKPLISFDIKLPANRNFQVSNDIITNVNTRLDQLRDDDGEMNKQVFSLLLLNRFVADNPFASSGGSTPVSTLAKQSVSRLLTEQLNRLATDLVKGVDLNFDVQASEDYTTGSRRDRTDLNVGLSKKLMNDRLTVTVGSNFELEGPQNSNQQSNDIAGNVAMDYKISKDGRYVLRAYRKNEYQGVIDGYVIETGVGFIITVDYNKFRELFQSRRSRRSRQQTTNANGKNEEQKNIKPVEAEKPPVKQ